MFVKYFIGSIVETYRIKYFPLSLKPILCGTQEVCIPVFEMRRPKPWTSAVLRNHTTSPSVSISEGGHDPRGLMFTPVNIFSEALFVTHGLTDDLLSIEQNTENNKQPRKL